jgi:transmembrane sensor
MDSGTIEEIAAQWILRQDDESWTAADAAHLEAWLEESVLHRVAFIRLETVWQETPRLKALGAGLPKGAVPPLGNFKTAAGRSTAEEPEARSGHRYIRGWKRWAALAAGVALAFLGASYLLLSDVSAANYYSTPIGGLATVPLADGSTLSLNTATRIRVSLGKRERRVDLESGEAYFVVAKDNARPFVIYVGTKQVKAMGTEFSVRRAADDLQVYVTAGRVLLTTSPQDASAGSVSLEAGMTAQTLNYEIQVSHATPTQLEDALSWRTGFVTFRNTVLSDAVAEFNRYRVRKIVIGDPSIAPLRISGKFRAGNADAFIWLLQQGFPVTVEEQQRRTVLKKRP